MRPKVHRGYENREDVASPQAIKKIYFHSIAVSINKNCSDHVKKIRTPRDNLANRIAVEYVANFMRKHKMLNAQEIGFLESGEYIQENHDTNWICRRLGLLTTRPVFPQLIDVLGRDPDYQSTIDEELSKAGKLPPPPKERSRAQSTVPDVSPEDCLQSSDGCFTSFMTTGVPEDSYTSRSHHREHRHHHHHRSNERSHRSHSRDYMIPDEPTVTFTQLETQEEQNRYFKSSKPRHHKSSKDESSKKSSESSKPDHRERSKRFVQQPQTNSYVDTYIPERKKTTTAQSTKTPTAEEAPKPKGTFLERFAALMIPNKYSNYEVQTHRVEQYPTLATADFRDEEPGSETLSATGERFENTNNVLAAFLDRMEGPERRPIAPARDESYRVADLQATVSVTDTQTAARADSSERLPPPPAEEEPLLKPRSSASRTHTSTSTNTNTNTGTSTPKSKSRTHSRASTGTGTRTGTDTKTLSTEAKEEEKAPKSSAASTKSTKSTKSVKSVKSTKSAKSTKTAGDEDEEKMKPNVEEEKPKEEEEEKPKVEEEKKNEKDSSSDSYEEESYTETYSQSTKKSKKSNSSLGSLKKPEPESESSSSSSYEYEEEEEEEEVVEVIEEDDSDPEEKKKAKPKVIIIEEEEDEEEEVIEEVQEVVVEED